MKFMAPAMLVFLAVSLIGERRETKFWRDSAKQMATLAEEARDVALDATKTAERAVRLTTAWEKVAILCAEKLGVQIEVVGGTNVVLSAQPNPI